MTIKALSDDVIITALRHCDDVTCIITALSDCEGVVSMLRRRCVDDKVGVRRAAVQAVASIVAVEGDTVNKLVSYRILHIMSF